jgi:HK97 gp10 family phage protein
MAKTTIVVTMNRFPEIVAKLPAETSTVVRKAAFDLEGKAKTLVPVDTGTLKNSIQTHMASGATSAEVQAGDETTPYGKTTHTGAKSTSVTPSAEYAAAVEFGAKGKGGRPYMTPAAEAVRPAFKAAMQQLLERL